MDNRRAYRIPWDRAIRLFGGEDGLRARARSLGFQRSTVANWKHRDGAIPAQNLLRLLNSRPMPADDPEVVDALVRGARAAARTMADRPGLTPLFGPLLVIDDETCREFGRLLLAVWLRRPSPPDG